MEDSKSGGHGIRSVDILGGGEGQALAVELRGPLRDGFEVGGGYDRGGRGPVSGGLQKPGVMSHEPCWL